LQSKFVHCAYQFTGKERDTESGLDYFGARYYASSMGRFMSPDWAAKAQPVPYARLDNPQSLNLYAYVANNPLSRIDPDGHYECAGSKDQCAQIQTALNLAKAAVKDLGADSKEGKAIQKVIDLYGDAGKKNGVNVSFGTFKNPNVTGQAVMGKDGSINIKFDLTKINASGSNSSQPGASMFGERVGTVVHEGTHGVDERRWGHNPQTDQQEDWTEHNAYRNESYAITGLGWFSASGQFSPGMSVKDREAAIDVDAKASDAASKQP
jgi:RHS repeat-associated protein